MQIRLFPRIGALFPDHGYRSSCILVPFNPQIGSVGPVYWSATCGILLILLYFFSLKNLNSYKNLYFCCVSLGFVTKQLRNSHHIADVRCLLEDHIKYKPQAQYL